jgi:ABC-type transport system involved in multi-copper enzyme maturation permease subunit
MNWLLWREYRINAALLIVGAALLLLPYLFTLILFLWPRDFPFQRSEIAEGYAIAAVISYVLSQLTIAFLGGNAFAGERIDRSAEFMAYLPVSKVRRVVGKLCLAAIVITLIWGINLLVLWALTRPPWILPNFKADEMMHTAVIGLVAFGVGWCVSSLQSSPTFAVCAGIAVPLVTSIGLAIVANQLKMDAHQFWMWYKAISITLGLAGFALGTWYFLKRVGP